MEEDIKVLEEYLNYEVTKRKLSGCEILAIENLIARNKELEIKQELLKILQDKINEQSLFINEIKEDYIPKSKVRVLIEKYRAFDWHNKNDEYWANRILDGFEELLQEGDK